MLSCVSLPRSNAHGCALHTSQSLPVYCVVPTCCYIACDCFRIYLQTHRLIPSLAHPFTSHVVAFTTAFVLFLATPFVVVLSATLWQLPLYIDVFFLSFSLIMLLLPSAPWRFSHHPLTCRTILLLYFPSVSGSCLLDSHFGISTRIVILHFVLHSLQWPWWDFLHGSYVCDWTACSWWLFFAAWCCSIFVVGESARGSHGEQRNVVATRTLGHDAPFGLLFVHLSSIVLLLILFMIDNLISGAWSPQIGYCAQLDSSWRLDFVGQIRLVVL